MQTHQQNQNSHRLLFDDASILTATSQGALASVEAITHLKEPVYSHLNRFCYFEVVGHRRLSISFSPCDDTSIEVKNWQYPVGRPAEFAYVDEGGMFRVVRAKSAEKGPFTELAAGPLKRNDMLTIELQDDGKPLFQISLQDWAAQASTALSPTAGWQVPVNSIEFQRSGESANSAAYIWISLAATSVGRGWDCVGHSAGIYQNRIAIKSMPLNGNLNGE